MSDQRSKEWFEMRRGRATASEIHNIMGIKGMGATGESYAFKKACEIVYGIDEDEDQYVSFDVKRGIALEPLAFQKFKELMYLNFVDVTEAYFYPYGEDAGASPDANVGDSQIAEFKCPRPEKIFRLIAKGEEAIDAVYKDQMQFQMLCSNSLRCHFFNYGIYNSKEIWHHIVVERNEKRIELMKERLKEFIKLRDEFVEYLIKNQQF